MQLTRCLLDVTLVCELKENISRVYGEYKPKISCHTLTYSAWAATHGRMEERRALRCVPPSMTIWITTDASCQIKLVPVESLSLPASILHFSVTGDLKMSCHCSICSCWRIYIYFWLIKTGWQQLILYNYRVKYWTGEDAGRDWRGGELLSQHLATEWRKSWKTSVCRVDTRQRFDCSMFRKRNTYKEYSTNVYV